MGQCVNSTVLDASLPEVWQVIREFHVFSWDVPIIEKIEKAGNISGIEVGAKRILNGVFYETLTYFDESTRSFS